MTDKNRDDTIKGSKDTYPTTDHFIRLLKLNLTNDKHFQSYYPLMH